jgi:hypothetical protein
MAELKDKPDLTLGLLTSTTREVEGMVINSGKKNREAGRKENPAPIRRLFRTKSRRFIYLHPLAGNIANGNINFNSLAD